MKKLPGAALYTGIAALVAGIALRLAGQETLPDAAYAAGLALFFGGIMGLCAKK
jgi:hypothetical protein